MVVTLDSITPENGFPSDMEDADKIFVYGQSMAYPDMSDDDKIFLMIEGLRYAKERNEWRYQNPYFDPNQVLDLLAEHGR